MSTARGSISSTGAGRRTAPGVLLIHGLGQTAWAWAPVARRSPARPGWSPWICAATASPIADRRLRARPAGRGCDRRRRGFGLWRRRESGSCSPATASARSLRPGRRARSRPGACAAASCSSTAAGRTSRRPAAWSPTSGCRASTSRPRCCAPWGLSRRSARLRSRDLGRGPGACGARHGRRGAGGPVVPARDRTRWPASVRGDVRVPAGGGAGGDRAARSWRWSPTTRTACAPRTGSGSRGAGGRGPSRSPPPRIPGAGHNLMRYRPGAVAAAILGVARTIGR